MLHILFALEGFFPYQRAGTEVYTLNLAKALREEGHTISFAVSFKEASFVEDYSFEDFKVYTFPISSTVVPEEANGVVPPAGLLAFIEIVKNVDPDVVHFHSFGRAINYYHLLAVKELHIKTVFTPHLGGILCARGDFNYLGKLACSGEINTKKCFTCFTHSKINNQVAAHIIGAAYTTLQHIPIYSFFPPAWRVIEHRQKELKALRVADAVISLSPWITEALKLNGVEENVHLVSQGVQTAFDAKPIPQRSTSKPIVGYVGRMHPIKGVEILLNAIRNLGNKVHFKILTMAPVPEDAYFAKIKKEFLVMKSVTWKENLPHDVFLEEYKQIDLLCLPSLHEMAPLVVQEAAAIKVPVLGASIPAITDRITHGVNGLIFERGNAEDLVQQLEKVVNDPELLSALKNNIKPIKAFKDVGYEMHEIYTRILNDNSTS